MSPMAPLEFVTAWPQADICNWRSCTPGTSKGRSERVTYSVAQKLLLLLPVDQSGWRRSTVVELASVTCATAAETQRLKASPTAAAKLPPPVRSPRADP